MTDFLIHGVWLQSTYKETMSLWRPEAEMQTRMGWLMLGQLLAAATAVVLWAKGFAAGATLWCACLFGLCLGLFSQATTLITYAVQPFPPGLAAKWFVADVGQGVLMGVLLFFVYKPQRVEDKPAGS